MHLKYIFTQETQILFVPHHIGACGTIQLYDLELLLQALLTLSPPIMWPENSIVIIKLFVQFLLLL